eukprot:9481041-Pyramimonas_sp.AAC.1
MRRRWTRGRLSWNTAPWSASAGAHGKSALTTSSPASASDTTLQIRRSRKVLASNTSLSPMISNCVALSLGVIVARFLWRAIAASTLAKCFALLISTPRCWGLKRRKAQVRSPILVPSRMAASGLSWTSSSKRSFSAEAAGEVPC